MRGASSKFLRRSVTRRINEWKQTNLEAKCVCVLWKQIQKIEFNICASRSVPLELFCQVYSIVFHLNVTLLRHWPIDLAKSHWLCVQFIRSSARLFMKFSPNVEIEMNVIALRLVCISISNETITISRQSTRSCN